MALETQTYKISSYSETPLEDYLNELSNNREEFREPEPSFSQVTNSDEPEPLSPGSGSPEPVISPVEKMDPKVLASKREFTAKFLGKNTDRAMAFLTALIADTDDVEEWKASPDDLKDLIECYYEMAVGYGWAGLPPWLNLVLCIGFTYGPRMREAYKARGINKELARRLVESETKRIIAEKEKEIQAKESAKQNAKNDSAGQEPNNSSNPNKPS